MHSAPFFLLLRRPASHRRLEIIVRGLLPNASTDSFPSVTKRVSFTTRLAGQELASAPQCETVLPLGHFHQPSAVEPSYVPFEGDSAPKRQHAEMERCLEMAANTDL